MVPVALGPVSFKDTHEETGEGKAKQILGPRHLTPNLQTGEVYQSPRHHSFLLNILLSSKDINFRAPLTEGCVFPKDKFSQTFVMSFLFNM